MTPPFPTDRPDPDWRVRLQALLALLTEPKPDRRYSHNRRLVRVPGGRTAASPVRA